MLVEMMSPAFKEKDEVRPPIMLMCHKVTHKN